MRFSPRFLLLAAFVGATMLNAGVPYRSLPLVGVAAMVGAYEFSYSAAPPEVMSTSVSAVTALLMTSAVGFLATAVLSPREPRPSTFFSRRTTADEETTSFDEMMETSK